MSVSTQLSAQLSRITEATLAQLNHITERVVAAVDTGGTEQTAHYADNGAWVHAPIDEASKWVDNDYDHGNWTSGFWVGALLRCRELGSTHPTLVARAMTLNTRIFSRCHDRGTHDLGFLFYPSAALIADTFDHHPSAATALHAAHALADRAVEPSGHLQAFGTIGEDTSRPTSTIDTMMNLPLLHWANRHSNKRDWLATATAHADRTMHTLVRTDGSTFHLAHIADTGQPIWQGTFQGAADHSCWARGQAWSIAGYITMATATGAPRYRNIAAHLLDYYFTHHDPTTLTPYDLSINTGIYDSSAAAIVCYGLAHAVTHNPQFAEQLHAQDRLPILLETLRTKALLQDSVGVLAHACYSLPHNRGIDGPLPYGDYFYLTALSLINNYE